HHENEQFTSRLAEAVLNARASATPASPVRFAHTVVEVQPDGWSRSVRADLLTLNEDISLASFNAEIMSSRVASLARFSAQVMPASCAGSSIGYWPTDRMLPEGGYESCDSRQFFPPLQWDSPSPDSLWDSV